MAAPAENTAAPQEGRPTDKELNFQKLHSQYERQLEQVRQEKLEMERKYQEAISKAKPRDEDDEDVSEEPYVDHKKLSKKLKKSEAETREYTKQEIQRGIQEALAEERRNMWVKQNPDFYETMQHAEKLAQANPDLAETILQMPDGFERQKLVYNNIKALGLHRPPEEKRSSIQDKIDANKQSPYYMPSGQGAAGYVSASDFSPTGMKQAYDKVQALKKRISQ